MRYPVPFFAGFHCATIVRYFWSRLLSKTNFFQKMTKKKKYGIMSAGVHIGDNVVIGAGSVVTRDMPKWSFAAGNPCKVIRAITKEDKEYAFKQQKMDEEIRKRI